MSDRLRWIARCKTLKGIQAPKPATEYQVAPALDGKGGLRWSKPLPWPPKEETLEQLPYPARVRFLGDDEKLHWGHVIVDPSHPAARDAVNVPSRREYRQTRDAERRRRWEEGRKGKRGGLAARVAKLEREMAEIRAERKVSE